MPKHGEEFLFADYARHKMADRISHDLAVQRGKSCKPILDESGPNGGERIPVVERKRRHLETLAASLENLSQRHLLCGGSSSGPERFPKFASLLAPLVRTVIRLMLLTK